MCVSVCLCVWVGRRGGEQYAKPMMEEEEKEHRKEAGKMQGIGREQQE